MEAPLRREEAPFAYFAPWRMPPPPFGGGAPGAESAESAAIFPLRHIRARERLIVKNAALSAFFPFLFSIFARRSYTKRKI